jgi:hypothetical protein
MIKIINAYMTLVRKPDGKKVIGIPRRRLLVNIKAEFKEIYENVDWLHLA